MNPFDQLDAQYVNVMRDYNSYSLLKFLPKVDAVETTPIGYTGVNSVDGNSFLSMDLLDNLHTPESCKLAAGISASNLKYWDYSDVQSGTNGKTPGLKYKIVNGYYNDDPKYFLDTTHDLQDARATGISTKFDSLRDVMNDNLQLINSISPDSNGNGHQFSIEWVGVCIPDHTGMWKFGLNTNDSSFLWIGNKANYLYNIKNADIQNPGTHGMVYKETMVSLIAGNIYPIRIQYGEWNYGHEFMLSVIPPHDTTRDDYYDVFYSLTQEPRSLYYSLVQPDPVLAERNLFQCYTTNPTLPTNVNQMKKLTLFDSLESETEIKQIWSLYTDETKLPGHGKTYLKFEEDSPSRDQQLNMYDSTNNSIIMTLYDTRTKTPNDGFTFYTDKPNYYLEMVSQENTITVRIVQMGNGFNDATPLKILFSGSFPDAIPNPQWLQDEAVSKSKSHSKAGLHYLGCRWDDNWNYKLQYVAPTSQEKTFLVSSDGKYKLFINDKGNLVLSYTKKNDSLKTRDGTIYTSNSNRFLYDLKVDEKMNKIFYADDISKNLNLISYNNDILKPNLNYLNLGNIPLNQSNLQQVENASNTLHGCREACDANAECHYFYKGDNQKCFLGIENTDNAYSGLIIPSDKIGVSDPNNQANLSSLYVKDKKIQMDTDHQNGPIRNETVSQLTDYSKYQYYSIRNTQITNDSSFNVGIISNTDYIDWFSKQNQLLFGREGFNTYDNSDCSLDPSGCLANIENRKIMPLVEMSQKYSNQLSQINSRNSDIHTKIKNYQDTRTDLSNNPQYLFNTTHISQEKTLMDGRQDDVQEMLLQENNMYIAGAITTFTLLIAGIMISTS